VLLVVGTLTWAGVSSRRRDDRALAVLATLSCPTCGKGFEHEHSVLMRKEDSARRKAALEDAQRRGVTLRLAGQWRFACVWCQAALIFDPDTHALRADDAEQG